MLLRIPRLKCTRYWEGESGPGPGKRRRRYQKGKQDQACPERKCEARQTEGSGPSQPWDHPRKGDPPPPSPAACCRRENASAQGSQKVYTAISHTASACSQSGKSARFPLLRPLCPPQVLLRPRPWISKGQQRQLSTSRAASQPTCPKPSTTKGARVL